MPVTSLTPAKIKKIRALCTLMCGSDIAKKIKVGRGVVNKYIRDNGLTQPREQLLKWRSANIVKPFTKREDNYIMKHLPKSTIKKIAKKLHRTGQYVSVRAKELGLGHIIEANAINSRRKKGYVPLNKGKKMSKEVYEKCKGTMFKAGHLPHNAIGFKNGDISIRQTHPNKGGRSYKWIRIGSGKWDLLHKVNWEEKNKKVLPANHCLWFKDGNTMNCNPSNLELITRQENLRRNRTAFLDASPELRTAQTLIKKLNKVIYGKEQIK